MSGNSEIGSEIFDFLYMNGTSESSSLDTSTLGPWTVNNCSWNDSLEGYNESQCNIPPQNSLWIRVVVFLLYGLVCVVGLCGNTLVIYVVLRFSKMQTVTNFYIVNLAIADECFLVGIPFIMTTLVVEYWPFGVIMCKIYFTTTSINQITSSMFLLIMSADRYLAVCHPISATKYRTQLIASIVALTAWSLSAIIMTPIFMYTNTLTVMDRVTCNIFWPPGWISGEQTFMMYSVLLGFLIPLLLISVFYVLVILKLQHVGPKRMPQLPVSKDGPNILNINQQNRAKDRKKSHRKVTKLVFTVITVYFTCWAPYWVTQIILIYMENQKVHSEFMLTTFLLTGCLSYSNSAMNPILYAFLSDNFKKSFLKACSCANRSKDINAAMQNENYPFAKNKKGEPNNMDKRRGTGTTIASTIGTTGTGPATSRVVTNPENHCGNPPRIITEAVDDDGFFDSDDEGAAILGRSAEYHESALTSRSATSEASKVTQETSGINEGVHVTSL